MKTCLIFFLLISKIAVAQCLSGDCQNGKGTYDFGFAVYEGEFKNGKPNGTGAMDYGSGEKFEGNFTNGLEDGDGMLYKKGIPTPVTYINGRVKERMVENIIGANAPKVEGCIVGDCYKGYGEINFPSGNKYKGNFLYGLKDGKGEFQFNNGDVLTADFKENFPLTGTYSYAEKGVTFTGTFDENTEPKTGKYYYPNFKSTVEVENGQITKVDNPVARRADSLAVENAKPKPCPDCGGKGMKAGFTHARTEEHYYTKTYVRTDGSIADMSFGNVMKSTTYETTAPTVCSRCNGTGQTPGGTVIMNPRYQH